MKSTQEITQEVRELGQWIPALRQQVGHVVIGQKYLVDRLLLGLLANGHLLLEGVPGLAKTLTVKTMAALHSDRFPKIAIYTGSSARGSNRHPYLQSADRRVYHQARPNLFKSNPCG